MGSQRKSKRGFIREVIEGVRQHVAVYKLQLQRQMKRKQLGNDTLLLSAD